MSQAKGSQKKIDRRSFHKTIGGTALGAAALATGPFPGSVLGANERVLMATIGLRNQGTSDTRDLIATGQVEFIAACDVDRRELDKYPERIGYEEDKPFKKFGDFRKLLEMKELDAVLIATPDHWHALTFLAACEAGKDIYLEKPISHNIIEGRAMVNAAKRFGRVVQVGTWQRSVQHYQDAIDFVRSGKLGPITVCRAWNHGGLNGIGNIPVSAPPAELDWDMWLGPAPFKLYRENAAHYNWRVFFDYGGGSTTDIGAHMIDICCLALGEWDATEITSYGDRFLIEDDSDMPDTLLTIFKFPNYILHWETRLGNQRGADGASQWYGSSWLGTNGTLSINRDHYEVFPEGDKLPDRPQTVNEVKANHYQNFIDCIKSRRKTVSDIETMHKTTTLCNLANISYRTGLSLKWDAQREVITNYPETMNCPQYQREYRAPWELKYVEG